MHLLSLGAPLQVEGHSVVNNKKIVIFAMIESLFPYGLNSRPTSQDVIPPHCQTQAWMKEEGDVDDL